MSTEFNSSKSGLRTPPTQDDLVFREIGVTKPSYRFTITQAKSGLQTPPTAFVTYLYFKMWRPIVVLVWFMREKVCADVVRKSKFLKHVCVVKFPQAPVDANRHVARDMHRNEVSDSTNPLTESRF